MEFPLSFIIPFLSSSFLAIGFRLLVVTAVNTTFLLLPPLPLPLPLLRLFPGRHSHNPILFFFFSHFRYHDSITSIRFTLLDVRALVNTTVFDLLLLFFGILNPTYFLSFWLDCVCMFHCVNWYHFLFLYIIVDCLIDVYGVWRLRDYLIHSWVLRSINWFSSCSMLLEFNSSLLVVYVGHNPGRMDNSPKHDAVD